MFSYICREPFASCLGNRPFLRLRVKQKMGDVFFCSVLGKPVLTGTKLEVLVMAGTGVSSALSTGRLI